MTRISDEYIASKEVGRYSSGMIRNTGGTRAVRYADGVYKNILSNGGIYPSPDSVALGSGVYDSGFVDNDTYSAVYGYFQSRSRSSDTARALAAMLVDASLVAGVSPLTVINFNDANISASIYEFINRVRPSNQQQGSASDRPLSDSKVGRKILA